MRLYRTHELHDDNGRCGEVACSKVYLAADADELIAKLVSNLRHDESCHVWVGDMEDWDAPDFKKRHRCSCSTQHLLKRLGLQEGVE